VKDYIKYDFVEDIGKYKI